MAVTDQKKKGQEGCHSYELEGCRKLAHCRQIQKMPESRAQTCALTTRSTELSPVPDLCFTSLGYMVVFTMPMSL